LPPDTSAARVRAEANFKKEERARDGAKAMTEYLENGRAVRERMEKLRALRLAKEAADGKAQETQAVAKPAVAKRTRSRS
jgi:hypothetical protein